MRLQNWHEWTERTEFSGFIITAVASLFFLETARELLGATYNMNLATMSLNSSVAAIFAFLSPFAYLLGLRRINVRTLVYTSGIILGICRLAMALNPATGVYLLCTVVAVVSFGIFLPAALVQFRTMMAPLFVCAVAVGAGADLVFRALGDTFDITVYGFTAQRLTALAVVLPLVIVFFALLVLWYRAPEGEQPAEGLGKAKKCKALFGCSLGALVFLYLYLMGYPNNAARWVDGPYSLAAVLFGAALGGFVLASVIPKVRTWLFSTAGFTAGTLVILLSFVVLLVFPVPVLFIVLFGLALFFLPVQVTAHIHYLMQPGVSVKQIGTYLTAAGVTFILLVLLSVFSLTYAHVPGVGFMRDQIELLLMCAALLGLAGSAVIRHRLKFPAQISISRNLAAFGICVFFGTILGVAIYQSTPVPPEPGEELTVMTYNIHQGFNTEGKINPYEILEPIQRVNPDILALQESDMNRISSTNTDIVQWFAHKLDMYIYFGPETKNQIYGVAILSKFPLTNTETYYLKSIEDQRVLIRADIQWAGQPLSVYAVHMGLSEEDRTNQAAEIVGILSQNPNRKILMGDLNSTPDSEQMKVFTQVLSDAWTCSGKPLMDPLGYTSDSLELQKRIDYILVSQELASYVQDCQVICDVCGSDHLPVWAEIAWLT